MATRSLTSISNDENVIQELHWDTISKKIEVVHFINLEEQRNAEWVEVRDYSAASLKEYQAKCAEYGLNPAANMVITEFVYNEVADNHFPEAHALKFPENGDYYPLSNLPHIIAVRLNQYQGGGVASKTTGEALNV